MIKFLFLLVLLMAISTGAFAQEFEVTGIIHQKQPVAIVNGKIVKAGDEIDGAVVQKILDKSVALKYRGNVIIKNVSGKRLPLEEEADIDNNPNVEKTSQKRSSFLLPGIILIFSGTGFYLFLKREKAQAE